MKYMDEVTAYENLANAIILSAVKEYKRALVRLKRHPDSESAKRAIRENEKFFYSPWFEMLTDLDPDYLVGRLKKMIDEKYGGNKTNAH